MCQTCFEISQVFQFSHRFTKDGFPNFHEKPGGLALRLHCVGRWFIEQTLRHGDTDRGGRTYNV